jgi:hypothetical protein
VRKAWETTGIHLFNPERILAAITRPKSLSPPISKSVKTPLYARSFRRTYKQLQKEGKVHQEASVLLRAGEKLATKLDIVRHKNEGLRKAIIHEKKKRNVGKP